MVDVDQEWLSFVIVYLIASVGVDPCTLSLLPFGVSVFILPNGLAKDSCSTFRFPFRKMNPIKITRLASEQTLWRHKTSI